MAQKQTNVGTKNNGEPINNKDISNTAAITFPKLKEDEPIIKICTERQLPLDPTTQIKAFEIAKSQNIRNVPESNIINPFHLALVRGKMHKPNALLKVKFLNGTDKQKQGVRAEAKEWENFANIKFNFVSSGNADIRIGFKWQGDAGSWSYIGTDIFNIPQNEATMNFGWLDINYQDKEEYKRVVKHEFGHTLGCIHEHQNPSVNIPWDEEAVYKYYAGPPNYWSKEDVDNNIFDRYGTTQTQYSQFDKESIMLYSIPNSLTIGDYEVGSNNILSEMDKDFIGTIYPFTIKEITSLSLGKNVTTTIGKYLEEDYYSFEILTDSAQKVSIYTSGSMDAVMSLMEYDSKKVIAWDDDSGQYRNSMIVKALNKGKYLIRIRNYSPTATGSYKLTLEGTTNLNSTLAPNDSMPKKKSSANTDKKTNTSTTKKLDSTEKAREQITGIHPKEKPRTKQEKTNAKIRGEI